MNWQLGLQLVTAVLGTGVLVTILNFCIQRRKEERSRLEALQYLSLRLAFQLEAYVIECANKVSDHRTAVESDRHAGALIGRVPQPEPFPESPSYPLMDIALLNDIWDFPQRCNMAQGSAMFYWDMLGDQDATNGAMEEHTLRMASLALSLSRAIRAKSKLMPRDLTFGKWDLPTFINDELNKHLEREARHQRQLAEHAQKSKAS